MKLQVLLLPFSVSQSCAFKKSSALLTLLENQHLCGKDGSPEVFPSHEELDSQSTYPVMESQQGKKKVHCSITEVCVCL